MFRRGKLIIIIIIIVPHKRTAHTQKAPTLFKGRYHYPLPGTAAVQSVGLPWLGCGRRASSRACENSHGR